MMVIIAFPSSINSTLTRLSQRLSAAPADRIFQCYIQFRSNGGLFVNLLPYCPRDLQLGGIDGDGALAIKCEWSIHRAAWAAITESTQVKTQKAENLRILVSGRDPRSRDESNGQRPRQLLPDGLGQSVGGFGQLASQK